MNKPPQPQRKPLPYEWTNSEPVWKVTQATLNRLEREGRKNATQLWPYGLCVYEALR